LLPDWVVNWYSFERLPIRLFRMPVPTSLIFFVVAAIAVSASMPALSVARTVTAPSASTR
jgi:hypothetical protein